MGNDCNKEATQTFQTNQNKTPLKAGCFACLRSSDFKNFEIDNAEFQTHNHELIPKGKISIGSIAYLKKEEISFLKACAGKNVSAIRHFLKLGVNVNLLDEDRTSPLHVACRSGSLQVIEELINCGANLNIADMAGWTPLHVAAYFDRSLVCHMLLKKGADPYLTNRNEETPWDLVKDKATEEIFHIHFDRIELRRMTKMGREENTTSKLDTLDLPELIQSPEVQTDIKIRSRDNVFRSMNDVEIKRAMKSRSTNALVRSVSGNEFKRNVESTKRLLSPRERKVKDISNKIPLTKRIDDNKENKENKENKRSRIIASRDYLSAENIIIPKKHKYYLHLKKLKSGLTKNPKEVQDVLKTLQSEESHDDSYRFSFNSRNNSQANDTFYNHGGEKIIKINLVPVTEGDINEENVTTSRDNKENEFVRMNTQKNKQTLKNLLSSNTKLQPNQMISSRNTSMNSLHSFKMDKAQPSNSILLVQPNISIYYLVIKNPQEVNFSSQKQFDIKGLVDTSAFKVDPRYHDALHKMGLELFNYDSFMGITYLHLFGFLKNNARDIAQFLYNDNTIGNIKKNYTEVMHFLTNFQIKESQEILEHFCSFINLDNMNFFDALRCYLSNMVLLNDPEKIDWILKAFAKRYYRIQKRQSKALRDGENFQNSDSVHMLAFAAIMLSIEIHHSGPVSEEKLQELRTEFHINLSGINDGENFSISFIDNLFDKIRKINMVKLVEDAPEKYRKLQIRSSKLQLKVHKTSNKRKEDLKDYQLYLNGPICLVVKSGDNGGHPKGIFMLNRCQLRQTNNIYLQLSPDNHSSGNAILYAKFRETGIMITSKSKLTFMLTKSEDYTKLEAHFNSVKY